MATASIDIARTALIAKFDGAGRQLMQVVTISISVP
jgi:hypothetical protein